MAALPEYPFPRRVALRLAMRVLFGGQLDFRQDARRCVAGLAPALQVLGREYIPQAGPGLLTLNHYTRPGFPSWWLTLAPSALVPGAIHWVVASAWTYPDRLRSALFTPATHWAFSRMARAYGFTSMPPMPPRPAEEAGRAQAVREVLAYARLAQQPLVGLAPEGRDGLPGGGLVAPPPGAGRFMLHLSSLGLPVIPLGVYEAGDPPGLCLRFGPPYRLAAPPGLPSAERDRCASDEVMRRIAALLPPALRGVYGG